MPRHGGGGGGSGTCCVEWWRASSRPGDVILGGHMSLGYADLLRGASLCNDSPAFIRVQNASGEQDDPLFRNFPSCTLPEGTSKSFSYFFFMLSPHLRLSLQARKKKKTWYPFHERHIDGVWLSDSASRLFHLAKLHYADIYLHLYINDLSLTSKLEAMLKNLL